MQQKESFLCHQPEYYHKEQSSGNYLKMNKIFSIEDEQARRSYFNSALPKVF
jgi:hypothetical protein